MKQSIQIAILVLFNWVSYSQLNPNTLLPNVMPSNPQAFQFMKYGEIPVQDYTGTPDISIPIYTLKTKAFDIPIILKYHPNGLKVNEEASWVGLGWNLSTDMEIVQTVQGLDDFGKYRWRSLANFDCMIPLQASGLQASSVMSGCSTFFLGLDDDWNQNHQNCLFDPRYLAGLVDTEPDVFYFNMAGYSGKFTLQWDSEKFVCLTDKNIKIESDYIGANPTEIPNSFSVTVPDGHRFYFELKDATTIDFTDTKDSATGSVVSSYIDPREEKSSRVYKLIKIMTSQSDVVDFTYVKSSNNVNNTITDAISKNFPYITQLVRNEVSYGANIPVLSGIPNSINPVGVQSLNMMPQYFTTSYTGTSQTYTYLKSIDYNGEHIEFITSSRQDLKEAKKLDEISVSFKGIFKRYLFNYDYYIGNNEGNNWDSFLTYGTIDPYYCNKTPDEINKRLKLISVNELNEKPYIFQYNSQSLPKKTSYALDYWGFYNGIHSNNTFFPNIYRFNIERDNTNYYNFQNNNNSPVLDYCKASTLEKITYPTGGATVFEYELNTFDNYKVPPVEQGNIQQFNLSTVPSQSSGTSKALFIEGGNTIFNIYGLLSVTGCFPQYQNAFTDCYFRVTHFKKELIDYIRNNSVLNNHLNSYGLLYVLGSDLDFLDGNPNNPSLFNQFNDMQDIYIRKTFTGSGYEYNNEWVNNRKINLKEGIVVFRVNSNCGTYSPTVNNNSAQSSFTISYRDYKPLPIGSSYGAGLRIKSITSYPSIIAGSSPVATKKNYEYEGGKLMTPLLYFNKMPSNYQIYKLVSHEGVYDLSFSTCFSPTLLTLNLQLNLEHEKFFNNPNFLSSSRAKQAFVSVCSLPISCIPPPGTKPIWTLFKNFMGYRNELHSQSYISPSTSASGRYVGYDKVTEKYENINSPSVGIGKEVNYYNNNPDIGAPPLDTGGGYYTQINIPLMIYYPENGNLIKKEIYNETNSLKQQVLNNYQFIQENCTWGMKTLTTDVTDVYVGPLLGDYVKKAKYLVGVYPIKSGKTLLTQSQIKYFENGSEISVLTNYTYDNKNQVSKISETNSSGNLIETSFLYPYNLSSTNYNTYSGMVNRNMLTPVVEKLVKNNGNPISLNKTEYKWINTPNPTSYFQSTYAIDKVKQSISGEYLDLEDIVLFHSYDQYSNPTEVSKKDGTRISYIWGYNGKYLLAKIENASQPNFDNATQGFTIIPANLMADAITASNSGTEANLITALNALRTNLPNAMVTTFTYKPLVGVSTITDVKGDITKYYYDNSNRLQFVKDKDGNVLNENVYHYKN
jgi:hypothetical protein